MEVEIKPTYTWIMKVILKQRDDIRQKDEWEEIVAWDKFNMNKAYKILQQWDEKVEWKNLIYIYSNSARPRSCFIIWISCHGRLSTKNRLSKLE